MIYAPVVGIPSILKTYSPIKYSVKEPAGFIDDPAEVFPSYTLCIDCHFSVLKWTYPIKAILGLTYSVA